MFSCHLQMMSSGSVVIFIEFPIMYWHFYLVLNAFVMVARAAMKVYIFHNCQFHAPSTSPFLLPHELYDDVTLDDICPPFHPPMCSTDGESDSDTRLTLAYFVVSDPSKPSYPLVIRLTSDSSSFSTPSQAPSMVGGHGFIRTCAVPRGHGCTRGGGCGDNAPSGFGNGYIPF